MSIKNTGPLLLLFFFSTCLNLTTLACSMYKITIGTKTIVGCNEDAWRTTSTIWFENAKNNNEYGAAFTGSRKVGNNLFAPQSGMNEAGLTFSRLASYFPKNNLPSTGKIEIKNEVTYLTSILHKCASVNEVKKYIEQFDHSFFIDDVFIYIDTSGKYLVVEPYNLLEGDDPYYLLSNFFPSITNDDARRKFERYRNGEDFLSSHKPDTVLSFYTELSDTMHVCRKRNGDGTLLTSIWDTENGLVNLYFYHDYDSTVQFNLAQELAKGDHLIPVANLFPSNSEYLRLATYKTPFNTPLLRVLLVIGGGILTLISLAFILVSAFTKRSNHSSNILIIIAVLNLLLTVYFFVLATNVNIYYFDVPYKHYSSNLISISSYIPFLLVLSMIPIVFSVFRFIKNERRKLVLKSLIIFNNLIYLVSIIGFGYWGLFGV